MTYIGNFFHNIAQIAKSIFLRRIDLTNTYYSADFCQIDAMSRQIKPYRLRKVKVGKGTYISQNARISNTSIGKFCSIGPNFLCGWGFHPLNGISTSPVFYSTAKQAGFTFSKENKVAERAEIKIGNDVFIGANVIVLDGFTIGDGAVIGAGAVVSKDIPPYSIAIGCPIKIVNKRFDENTVSRLMAVKWWDMDDDKLKGVEKYFFDIEGFLTDTEKK